MQTAHQSPPAKAGGFISPELEEKHLAGGSNGLLHGLVKAAQTMWAIIFQPTEVRLQRGAHVFGKGCALPLTRPIKITRSSCHRLRAGARNQIA
jgi:hypothetical protein